MWEQSTLWIEHLNDWFVSLFSDKMHPLLKEVNVYSRENHGLEMQLNSFIFPLLRPRGKHYKELKEREKNKTVLSLKKRAVFLVFQCNHIDRFWLKWPILFSLCQQFPSAEDNQKYPVLKIFIQKLISWHHKRLIIKVTINSSTGIGSTAS